MSMLRIRTATLRPNVLLGFDIYLQISGKHLLYVKRSDNIELERLSRLRDKNVREVYIDEKDRQAYEEFLNASAAAAVNDPKMPLQSKAEIVSGQAKAAVEEMFADPGKKENYQRTLSAAANQVALLLKNPEALEQVIKISSFDKTTYQHSVNVSAIAIGLAASLGAPVATCNAVGIGGLLHDIGKTAQKSDAGPEALRQHPREGAGLLLNKSYVTRDVLDIILMHEERLDGKGYPAGLKKLDQIFQVVGLANMYDRLVTFEGNDPQSAYGLISQMDPPPYDSTLIKGLKEVLVANKIY